MKINHDQLTEKQIANLNAAIKAYNDKSVVSSPLPAVLYIELTQNCIAKCDFCRGPQFVNKPAYNMRPEMFDILLHDCIPSAVLVDLHGWGESLMLPDFDQYIARVAQLGPQIRLTTTLGCGSPKALQSLIDHDVFVSISIDAAEKHVYENIRKGVNFDTLLKNIEFLSQGILKKHGSLEGRMRLGVVPLQESNLDQLEKIVQLAIQYRIPEIRIGPLHSGPNDPALLQYHRPKTIAVLQKCIELAKTAGIAFQLGRTPFAELRFKDKLFDLCCHPWLYGIIGYTGNFSYCDHLVHNSQEQVVLGNIQETPVAELWNGPKAQALRSAHIKKDGEALYSSCVSCYTKGRYADHEHELHPQFCKWLVTEKDLDARIAGMNAIDKVKLHVASHLRRMLRRFKSWHS
jgi:MoaA/NifB/PqqE/SkfB family radical SAM enzyme